MTIPVAVRTGFTGLRLRALAKQTGDVAFASRLLELAEIFAGGLRSDAAASAAAGCTDAILVLD